MKDYNDNVR